ncbi:MAG TPA: hypothetical protein VND68_01240 [Chloroflexia bacterium]|nr:hypothetical protein [Chloroflexia bacterium]
MTGISTGPETEQVAGVQTERVPRGKRVERAALFALVALYLAASCGFTIVTPYPEAPDEYGHLQYVEHIVRFGTLPTIARESYTYEALQAPLYYMVGAAFVGVGRVASGQKLNTFLTPWPQTNPAFAEGQSQAVMIHPPEDRWAFWVYILRAYSIVLGIGVVVLTYATARVLVPWPAPAAVPIMSAGFAALIPQANFIRGSISNENMVSLTGALLLWLLALHLVRPYHPRRALWIGVALGLGLLSKVIIVALVPVVVWALWVKCAGQLRVFLRDTAVMGAAATLVCGWLYAYRWIAYGDPLAYTASREVTQRSSFRLEDLFWFNEPFRAVLWKSFWGNYGWQQIWMPDLIYHVFMAITLLAVAGGVYLLLRRALTPAQRATCAMLLLSMLMIYILVVIVNTSQVIWQGRELYPVLSGVCVLLGLGISGVGFGRHTLEVLTEPLPDLRRYAGSTLLALATIFLLAVNVYSIFWLVLPALNP